MPARGFLTPGQQENLQQAVRESADKHLRERALMLLLMNDGKTYQEISTFLGCAYRSVAYWCVHGDADNLESLKDKREQGNHRKVTELYVELLLDVLEKEPSELGYEFGRWSGERLATYMAEQTGIKLSGKQVRRILEQKKYAYLWAKYTLQDKQDPKNRQAFKEKLEGYLEASKASPDKLQIWFWDESGFSMRVIRRRSWVKRGTRKKVTGQRSRGKVNVMGGVRYHDKKRMCYFIDKGNSTSFYEQIKKLHTFVKEEWINQGNVEDKFTSSEVKILIILDNASYHKKKDILEKIEQEMPNIQLYFLPPYSPDFNLAELVWHSVKEYIAHRLFKSVSELQELLDRLLNDGDLIIKWGRKIKNKGNAVIAS